MVRYSHIVSTWCWSSLCSERSRCSLPIVFLRPIPRAGQCCSGRWGGFDPPRLCRGCGSIGSAPGPATGLAASLQPAGVWLQFRVSPNYVFAIEILEDVGENALGSLWKGRCFLISFKTNL